MADPISTKLYSFSPLGQIYNKHLGLNDVNQNGTIDRGAGEGYEEFTESYGNADTGFSANGVIFGAANGHLEEPEIVNHYYLNVRFKNSEETENIERDLEQEIRASGIPLVWLDDEQGTVMNAVNRVLGTGWNEQEVSEDEAVRMFQRAANGLRITGRTTEMIDTGYYDLPEAIQHKSAYCFEIAQFQFWFFSKLKIKSLTATTMLTKSNQHDVIKLFPSGTIADYFGSSKRYRIPNNQWNINTPMQSISEFLSIQAIKNNSNQDDNRKIQLLENSVLYNKYDLTTVSLLIDRCIEEEKPDYNKIIELGEFILKNINIEKILSSKQLKTPILKDNLAIILYALLESYSLTRNENRFEAIVSLTNQYFPKDTNMQQNIEYYRYLLQ